MIRITSQEHIKKSGDFKLDGYHISDFHLEYPKTAGAKQKLTITMVPFARLDDGSKVFDFDNVIKVYLADAESYLLSSGDMDFLNAYFSTEKAISGLINAQHAGKALTTVFEMPAL